MAMTFEFNMRPFGYQNEAIQLGRMKVHSAGSRHEYTVDYKTKDGWGTCRGSVAKVVDGKLRSGHRNFLHLMADILDDIDLDELGTNYVHVLAEVEEMMPHMKGARVSNYDGD
jgi:hypothetical protein